MPQGLLAFLSLVVCGSKDACVCLALTSLLVPEKECPEAEVGPPDPRKDVEGNLGVVLPDLWCPWKDVPPAGPLLNLPSPGWGWLLLLLPDDNLMFRGVPARSMSDALAGLVLPRGPLNGPWLPGPEN